MPTAESLSALRLFGEDVACLDFVSNHSYWLEAVLVGLAKTVYIHRL
jgi:hypothetical protein